MILGMPSQRFLQQQRRHQSGFSLIETVIVSALILLMFGGLFAGLRLMINMVGHSKAEAGARSLAVAKIEYIRSLSYDAVGTVNGIPPGPLPQTSTTTLNGIEYTERILVQYLDRPEDGFGVNDENGITEDSKIVKVTYSWNLRNTPDELSIVTDLIPKGIESTSGGGTLFINVFDANVQPVPNAEVRVVNTTGTSTIDVTVETNANGIANFPGAPAQSGYEVTATKAGFSIDQTYSASSTNSNPNPPHVSVIAGEVSTVNFAIDETSDITFRTLGVPTTGTMEDTFSDDAFLAEQTDTVVSGGALQLASSSGSFVSNGTAMATTTAPEVLHSWYALDFTASTSPSTTYRIRLYAVSGSGTSTSYTLVPESDLPGNAAGFIAGPVDLSSLAVATYPALALNATLETSDPSATPKLQEWELTYVESQLPVSGVTVDVAGRKRIGEHEGVPVLKYTDAVTTDGSGLATLNDLEWDIYDITVDGVTEGYDIVEAHAVFPYALEPGVAKTVTLVVDTHTANSLWVTVVDSTGEPVAGADVALSRDPYEATDETSSYGQVFFGNVSAASGYNLTVSADGYETYTSSSVVIDGASRLKVELIGE